MKGARARRRKDAPTSPLPSLQNTGQHVNNEAKDENAGVRPQPAKRLKASAAENEIKESLRNVTLLYYAPEMKDLAESIAELSEGAVRLGEIRWQRFPDGFPNLFIKDADQLPWAHCAYLASLNEPSAIFEQLSVLFALPRHRSKSYKVIVPFFPTGTMERVQHHGEVATAQTLARMLSITPMCAGGPAQVCILDIHTLQNQFYFNDNVLVKLQSCTDLLVDKLRSREDIDDIVIAFPDDGAAKRFGDNFPNFPVVICQKVRDGDQRIVKLKEGDVKGKHVVIVDDLVQTGGTLIECARTLLQEGGARVSAYVTHAVFPNQSFLKFVDKKDGGSATVKFERFWTTNSLPSTAAFSNRAPFEVMSLAPVLEPFLRID